MSNVFEKYTKRVASQGESLRKRYELDTENFINQNFADSPTFRMIDVYKQTEHIGEFPVRVNMIERMGNIRNLLLPPRYDLDVGNMTMFEGRTWLIFDKYGFKEDHVKVTAMRTNYNLVWKGRNGTLKNCRCYASSSDIGSKSKQSRANIEFNKYDVKLPFGQLYIFLETRDDTETISLNQRFIVNKIVYEVVGIDNTTHVEDGYGIIQLTIQRVPVHHKDDFETGIAYNDYNSLPENPAYRNQADGDDSNTPVTDKNPSKEISEKSDEISEALKEKDSEDSGRGGMLW